MMLFSTWEISRHISGSQTLTKRNTTKEHHQEGRLLVGFAKRANQTQHSDSGTRINTTIQCPKHASAQYQRIVFGVDTSETKPTSLRFSGCCWGLPETKAVLVSKAQNQLSLHHSKASGIRESVI
jgi:hypothetical protein